MTVSYTLLFEAECAACSSPAQAVAGLGIGDLTVRGLSDPLIVEQLRQAGLEQPTRPALLIQEGTERDWSAAGPCAGRWPACWAGGERDRSWGSSRPRGSRTWPGWGPSPGAGSWAEERRQREEPSARCSSRARRSLRPRRPPPEAWSRPGRRTGGRRCAAQRCRPPSAPGALPRLPGLSTMPLIRSWSSPSARDRTVPVRRCRGGRGAASRVPAGELRHVRPGRRRARHA